MNTGLFIDGKWRDASDGGLITVVDPATGNSIASVANATVEDGLAAVNAAYDALPGWAACCRTSFR
jgi:succinate-semialdehyde dehydrogenase/glutarate-semialdehyde dehydrogenase